MWETVAQRRRCSHRRCGRRHRRALLGTLCIPPACAGDGTAKAVDLRNKEAAAVAAVLQAMRDVTTGRVRRFRRPVASRVPSVQGLWDPSNTFDDFELRESAASAPGSGAGAGAGTDEGTSAGAAAPVAAGSVTSEQQLR